jgi:hypothetical protein
MKPSLMSSLRWVFRVWRAFRLRPLLAACRIEPVRMEWAMARAPVGPERQARPTSGFVL